MTSEADRKSVALRLWSERYRPWLGLVFLVLAGAIVFWPALRSPFLLDDYLHASMIEGTFPGKRHFFDLYDFVNEADREALIERGMLPWWSDPTLEIRFFRPLASAIRWVEHVVVGEDSALLHLHSFLWWIATVVAARVFFRRVLSSRVALFATVIFALAPCHAMPLAWIANREVFMSLAFGIAAFDRYVRFRDERRAKDGALAGMFFALAVASGEYALCLAGYVVALEFGLRGERPLRRVLGTLPFVLPALVYMIVRTAFGYGTQGSGYYTDPIREPLRFFASAPRRVSILLSDMWLSFDYETLTPITSSWWIVAICVVATPIIVVSLRRVYGELDDVQRRWFRTFVIGSLLALVPVVGVSAAPRVVGASLLGVAPLVGMLLDHAWFVTASRPTDRSVRGQITSYAAIALGFAHLVHGPGAAWLSANRFFKTGVEFVVHAASLRERFVMPANAEIIVMRGIVNSFYIPFAIDQTGRLPARYRILSQTTHALVLRRGPRTLDIIVRPDDRIFASGRDHLFRPEENAFKVGDIVTMPGLRVTILAITERGPRIVRYEFDKELEAPTYTWLAESRSGFSIEEPLPIGLGKPFDM